jgi:hypothetical protein
MTDTTPSAVSAVLVALDSSRSTVSLSPADAAALAVPIAPADPGVGGPSLIAEALTPQPSASPPSEPPATGGDSLAPQSDPPKSGKVSGKGSVSLRPEVLRFLRFQKLLSQQDMADDCLCRRFRLSIATIKRSEGGDAVRYRTAREFARYFCVPVEYLLLQPIQ